VREELLAAPLPEERRLQVAALLRREAKVRVDDLAEQFAVSGETIRRDLKALEDRGIARRVYGGAVAFAPSTPESEAAAASVGMRGTVSAAAPGAARAIAAAAAALVGQGETVMLDFGPLCAETARALALSFSGRALCSDAHTAALLAAREGVEVHLAGGRLRAPDLACLDEAATEFFDRFFAHRAFLTADAVDARAGITCQALDEIPVRRALLRQAAEAFVLVEAGALGTIAVGRIASLGGLAGIITDGSADPAAVEALRGAGTRVIIAPSVPEMELE
jgi:DeoR family fructose operon transcriptional repressor